MSLQPGKLPQAMLAELLATIAHRDPRVIVSPGIGRDAAVIDLGGRMLVAKTDPVTFATDRIGWYAVHVNANDIACMGARPAWFMATALLPPGADAGLPRRIFDDLSAACAELDVELVGGHTEVTLGLERPILAGVMLGEASRDEIVTGGGISPGDAIVLTKGIAIEGTSLLAREQADELHAAGVPPETVARAAAMLFDPGISVVRDAATICETVRPRLMHDPTEGGIATALYEMAEHASMTLRVDVDAIPCLPETRVIAEALALDPLGLLASGALLAIVPADAADGVMGALVNARIGCRIIGHVEAGAARVIMGAEGTTPLRTFGRDELARYYDEAASAARSSSEGQRQV